MSFFITITIITTVIIGLMIFVFGTKDLLSIIINRTSIALLISTSFLGFCLYYSMNFSIYNWMTASGLKAAIDMFLSIPITIPLAFAYSGGDELAYFAFGIELLIMTIIVRLLIPKRIIIRLREKIKTIAQQKP